MPGSSWAKIIDNQVVNGNVTISSSAIDVSNSKNFSVVLVIETADTSEIKIQYQVIPSRAHDVDLVGAKPKEDTLSWVTPQVASQIIASSASTTGSIARGFSPMGTTWLRIQAIGEGSNGSTTKISVYLWAYHEL